MNSVETEIRFRLNGRDVSVKIPAAMKTLSMLRDVLGLTGTKYACGEGECGACTVQVDGKTVNSCLMYAVDCDGREVLTIEGLRTPEGLHPMQQAFVDHGAVQCGFCMPGMIMQAQNLVENNPGLTREEAQRGLEGNLCRCTGYTKVLDAVEAVAATEARRDGSETRRDGSEARRGGSEAGLAGSEVRRGRS